jgi:protocatechuate 3,4-dioxygenase beta subunit
VLDAGEEHVAVAHEGLEAAAGAHLKDVDFELIEGALVEGTVTLADTGQPGVGAGIYARGPARPKSAQERHWAGTDEQGHYRLRLAPGDNEVRYTPSMRLPGYPTKRAQPERYEVTLENGERRTGLDFLLRPAQKVAGVVLGPDGEPAPGVEVWLCGAAGPQRERETDEEGRFSLSLGNGSRRAPWLVLARDAERDLAGAAVVHSPDEEGVIRLEQGAYLVASVRDPESKPLEGVEAKVAVDPDERGYWVLPLPFASEADGRLRMGPLPPGQPLRVTVDWEVEQKAVSDRWWRVDAVTLAPGEQRELPPLVLNLAGRSLRGTVVDERQQPVEGAIVCTAAFRPRTMTGAEGRFELSGLKARGTVVVLALAPESGRACALERDPDLVPEANLVLERAPVLQGVVYDPEGRPKPGVEVRLYPRGVDSHFEVLQGFVIGRDTESDERGRYRFEKVVPGFRYQVFVHDEEGHIRGNTAELVAEGGEEPMVMDIYMQ